MAGAPARDRPAAPTLPARVREPLDRARLLAIQMQNPAVPISRWTPKLMEWLDEASHQASRSRDIPVAVADTIRDASVLVHVLADSSPREVKTYLPELVVILEELLGHRPEVS